MPVALSVQFQFQCPLESHVLAHKIQAIFYSSSAFSSCTYHTENGNGLSEFPLSLSLSLVAPGEGQLTAACGTASQLTHAGIYPESWGWRDVSALQNPWSVARVTSSSSKSLACTSTSQRVRVVSPFERVPYVRHTCTYTPSVGL